MDFNDWVEKRTQDQQGDNLIGALAEVGSFRPTLYIGLGGFGCAVIRKVKRGIHSFTSDQSIRDGFCFIGMDTHPYDGQSDVLARTEYVPLSISVHPDTVARDRPEALGWYRDVAQGWRARNLSPGADKVKAAGRLALLYPPTLRDFMTRLKGAFNELIQFREKFAGGGFPKIYIVTSIGGGTGAGCFLDTCIMVRKLAFDQLGANTQVQAIVAGPDALEGEANESDMRDFYANAYATLKETSHFIRGKEEVVHYDHPDLGRIRVGRDHIPNPFFLVTDRNEDNRAIVERLEDLGDLVVSYLQNEIKTPMENHENGQPKPQDNENPSGDVFGHGNMPKAISSIGVVQAGMPRDLIQHNFVHSLIVDAIDRELHVVGVEGDVNHWVHENGLAEDGSDQLQENLRRDKEGRLVQLTFVSTDRLEGVKRQDLVRACVALKQSSVTSIGTQYGARYDDNAARIQANAVASLDKRFDEIINTGSLGTAYQFLIEGREALLRHQASLSSELAEANDKLARSSAQVDASTQNVGDAASSSWLGRNGRVNMAVNALDGDMQVYLNLQLMVWSMERSLNVYGHLLTTCQDLASNWAHPVKALGARRTAALREIHDCEKKLNTAANINKRGPGNRFSLVDAIRSRDIFSVLFSVEEKEGICQRARVAWREQNLIPDTSSRDSPWLDRSQATIAEDVTDKLVHFKLPDLIHRYYPEDAHKKELFNQLASLASPLFPVDVHYQEECQQYWIVAAAPPIKDEIEAMCGRYFDTQGLMGAYFENPHEIIIYCIKHGYTLHSMARTNQYCSNYMSLMDIHRTVRRDGNTARPIHGWPGADRWGEIAPRAPGEDDTYKWFILGRAFSSVFPTPEAEKPDGSIDSDKNKAFLFNRGSNYYIQEAGKSRPTVIGRSLQTALEEFSDRPDWQVLIKASIEAKVRELGEEVVSQNLESHYLPVLTEELESAIRGTDDDRAHLLALLMEQLDKYLNTDLKSQRV